MDEGYIKFKYDWEETTPFANEEIEELNRWRDILYKQKLLGAYPDGIGYGNVSIRTNKNNFLISGSKTGLLKELDERHYSKVIEFDISKNYIKCQGPLIASSESMSHAVIYQACSAVQAVFHIHSRKMWDRLLYKVPTTSAKISYGTPEMAYEIIKLIKNQNFKSQGFFAMAGHVEGIFAFGKNCEQAGKKIFSSIK